jgi:fucose 4-O-acetylase-like acetyltransferase
LRRWWQIAGVYSAGGERIHWVDAARGVGIMTVFFGHYLQDASPRHPAAMDDLRFLYAFHVPFFFVLSGCFAHRETSLLQQARVLAARRLLPVLFFGVCFALLGVLARVRHGAFSASWLEEDAAEYLIGRPILDWATWFLVCLFVSELFAFLVLAYVRKPALQLVTGILAVIAGAAFGNDSNRPAEGLVYYIGEFWFFSEAIVALGFYLIGRALWPWLRSHMSSLPTAVLMASAGFLVVLATFRLNTVDGQPVVVMLAARTNGNVMWFLITALAGSLALLATGALLGRWKSLGLIGRNTIPLLGLNGLFFGQLNVLVVHHFATPATHLGVLVLGALVTCASLVICAPLVWTLQRLVPQLMGRPRQAGPLLPALE